MGVIAQGVGAVTIEQALAQRNRAKENSLRDRDPEEDEPDAEELSDDEWVRQQDEELEKNEAENITAMIQRGFNKPTPIPSGSATPSEQQLGVSKAKTSISGGVPVSSNHRNSITFKETLKSKRTNRDRSHSPPAKRTKITGGQKLADSIHAVVEELKLSREGKTEPTERAVKQLVELYGDNSTLLSGGLTLLQDVRKVPIFLSLNGDSQKLWLSSECDMLLSKNP